MIEDSYDDEEIIKGIWEVYHSWIDEHISDYNRTFIISREIILQRVMRKEPSYDETKKEVRIWEWE